MKIYFASVFLFLSIFTLPFQNAFAGQPLHSTESYTHYLKALMFDSQGNFVSALEEVEKAIELAPDSAYLYRIRAELALRLGKVNEAANSIETANDMDPSDVKALILAGQIQWALGNNSKAEEKLKRAVALDPDASEALVSLAGTLAAKKPEEAIKLYKEFLVRHPGEMAILERLAQLYQELGQMDNAKKVWEEALINSPSYARAHLSLAQIAEVNFDTTTAISHYEAVMQDDPDNLPLLLRVGELRYRNNEMSKAYEAFSKARAIAPSSTSANFWLALLSEHRGDWDDAIQLLGQVLNQSLDPGVLLRLSYYYSQAGKFKDAVRVLKQLSDTQPNNIDFLGYLAIAYEQNRQFAKAEKIVKRIIQIRPQNPEAHFHLATLSDRMGKFSAAESALKKAISLKPDYHAALNYLGYSYAERDIKLEEAERLLTNAVGFDPENPAYMDSMGWLYFRQGKLQKAADFLKEAALRANDPVVWDHLGTVQASQGDFIDAMLSWDDGLRLEPTSKSMLKKIPAVMNRLTNNQKVDLFVRRSNLHFSDIGTIKGLCKIKVCEKLPCFETKAQLAYYKDGEMLIEIPGPLTGPVLQLRKKHGYPTQYGALHPVFQTIEYYATRAFDRIESVLSADAFRLIILDEFSKNASENRDGLSANDGVVSARFNKNNGLVREIEWIGKAGGDLLRVGPYKLYSQSQNGTLPSFLEWIDKQSGFKIRLEFLNPVISKTSALVEEK